MELSEGHVSELVDSHGVGGLGVEVVVADLVVVSLEDVVTWEELIMSVLLVVLLDEAGEEVLVFLLTERLQKMEERISHI